MAIEAVKTKPVDFSVGQSLTNKFDVNGTSFQILHLNGGTIILVDTDNRKSVVFPDIEKALIPRVAILTIQRMYDFDSKYKDMIATLVVKFMAILIKQ